MKILINETQYNLLIENQEYLNQIRELIGSFNDDNIELAFQIAKGLNIKQSDILEGYRALFEIFGRQGKSGTGSRLKLTKENFKKILKTKEVDIYENHKYHTDDFHILFQLPNLEEINFYSINGLNLDRIVTFNGHLYFKDCLISRMENLKEVNKLVIYNSHISLPQLEKARYLSIYNYYGGRKLELPELKSSVIIKIYDKSINGLPKLEKVGRLDLSYCLSLSLLPNLEYVDDNLIIEETKIKKLPKLKYVGGDLNIIKTPLRDSNEFKNDIGNKFRNKFGVQGKIIYN